MILILKHATLQFILPNEFTRYLDNASDAIVWNPLFRDGAFGHR